MLKCKDVAQLASDYLDKHTDGKLNVKIRLHLMLCANCRRFVQHLRITRSVAISLANPGDEVDAESLLRRIKQKL